MDVDIGDFLQRNPIADYGMVPPRLLRTNRFSGLKRCVRAAVLALLIVADFRIETEAFDSGGQSRVAGKIVDGQHGSILLNEQNRLGEGSPHHLKSIENA